MINDSLLIELKWIDIIINLTKKEILSRSLSTILDGNIPYTKKKLYVLWTNSAPVTAEKMVFMYPELCADLSETAAAVWAHKPH